MCLAQDSQRARSTTAWNNSRMEKLHYKNDPHHKIRRKSKTKRISWKETTIEIHPEYSPKLSTDQKMSSVINWLEETKETLTSANNLSVVKLKFKNVH